MCGLLSVLPGPSTRLSPAIQLCDLAGTRPSLDPAKLDVMPHFELTPAHEKGRS